MRTGIRLVLAAVILAVTFTARAEVTSDVVVNVSRPISVGITHPASFLLIQSESVVRDAARIGLGETVLLDVTVPDIGQTRLVLTRFDVLDASSTIVALGNNGSQQPLSQPLGLLLHGQIEGRSSHVMLAVYRTWCTGYITDDVTGHRYLIGMVGSSAPNVAVVYDERFGQKRDSWICGVDDLTDDVRRPEKDVEQAQAVTRVIRLAVECDEEFYIDHNRDVYRSVEYVQAVIGAVSDIYERDADATISTTWMGVWTTTDPFPGTSSNDLFAQLRTYWLNNRAGVDRNCVMLLSGVNGIGGLANLDALCSNTNGYSVSGTNNNLTYPVTGYAWDTDVVAHELGHNVGARHTHSCWWAPPIDSCFTAEGGCFSGTRPRRGTIMSYCHLTTFGTELIIDSRVATHMKNRLAARTCVGTPGTFTVTANSDTAICIGDVMTLVANVSGGTQPYTYSWTPRIELGSPTVPVSTAAPTNDIVYVIEVRDAGNRVVTDTVRVSVGPRLSVSTTPTVAVCRDGIASITATPSNVVGTAQYRWTLGDRDTVTTSATLMFPAPNVDTLYVVCRLTDSRNACFALDTTTVTVRPAPFVTIDAVPPVCSADVVRINARTAGGRAPFTMQWFVDGVPRANPDTELILPVDRSVTVRCIGVDANGCADTAETFVDVRTLRLDVRTPTAAVATSSCDTAVQARIIVSNPGTLSVFIRTLTSPGSITSLRPLPIEVFPGQTDSIDVLITGLPEGVVDAPIVLMETSCNMSWSTRLLARVGSVSVASTLPVIMAEGVACLGTSSREIVVDIRNTSSVTADVVSVRLTSRRELSAVEATRLNAATTTRLRATLLTTIPAGTIDDTLVVEYSTPSCSDVLTVPIRYGDVAWTFSRPDVIDFGNVDVSVPEIQQRFELRPSMSPVRSIQIDSVHINPPFSTTLARGTTFMNDQTMSSRITLTTTGLPAGLIIDTLTFRFEGCTDVVRIPVRASVEVVGVDDVNLPNVVIRRSGQVLTIDTPGDHSVIVYDVHGRSTASFEGRSSEFDMSDLARGVYVVVLHSNSQTHRFTIVH